MKYDEDLMSLMSQAQAAREQFIGGFLRHAWNAAFEFIRCRFSQSRRRPSSRRPELAKLLSS